jgi:hypothetical protein
MKTRPDATRSGFQFTTYINPDEIYARNFKRRHLGPASMYLLDIFSEPAAMSRTDVRSHVPSLTPTKRALTAVFIDRCLCLRLDICPRC